MQPGRVLELLKDRSSQKGFEALYEWFRYPALGFLINAGRLSQSDADDVFQETIIKIFKSIDQLKDEQRFESWVWQILRNSMLDFIRKTKRKNETIFNIESEDLENLIGQENIQIKMNQEFSSSSECVEERMKIIQEHMPERHYVLTLQTEGLPIKEIATRINRTPAATKEFLSQSRKKIAPYLEECLGVEINE